MTGEDSDPRSALRRAHQTSERAATLGFDWPDVKGPRAKVDEELAELDEAIIGAQLERVEDELGDLLFTIVNVARHLGLDSERALHAAVQKFERRFAHVESLGDLTQHSPEALDAAWNAAKEL